MTIRYSIASIRTPENVVHGFSLEQAAEVVQIDADELAFAVEEYGEGTTDEHRVFPTPENAPSECSMQDPDEYAALSLSFAAGDRGRALADFVHATQTDPTFALAPRSWVQAVAVAIAGGATCSPKR